MKYGVEEEWARVAGNNILQVSNTGKLKFASNVGRSRYTSKMVKFKDYDIPLKVTERGQIYLWRRLRKNGKVNLSVAKLVARAFIPDYDPHKPIYHVDGDKTNNHVMNLTQRINSQLRDSRYTIIEHTIKGLKDVQSLKLHKDYISYIYKGTGWTLDPFALKYKMHVLPTRLDWVEISLTKLKNINKAHNENIVKKIKEAVKLYELL